MNSLTIIVLTTSALFCIVVCSPTCNILETGTDNGEAVEVHNYFRNLLNAGQVPGQPKAKYIPPLKWDNYLAQEAMKIARTCVFGHKKVDDARFYVGQNIYAWSTTGKATPGIDWKSVVEPWFNEYKTYKYPQVGPAGHYTQVIWQTTTYVGCGYAIYQTPGSIWTNKLSVCNYGPGGNIVGVPPYETA